MRYLVSVCHPESRRIEHGLYNADNIRLAIAKAIAPITVEYELLKESELDDCLAELIKGHNGIKDVCSKYGFVVCHSIIGIQIM